jgi:signal transduction histidine kinase
MHNRASMGDLLFQATPAVVERYRRRLLEASNPLATVPELWRESQAHASLIVATCGRLLDLPDAEHGTRCHADELRASSAMGSLWACCTARLTDSLSAIDALALVTMDTVAELAAAEEPEQRAVIVVRATRIVNQVSSLHAQAAAVSYDAYLLNQIEQANAESRTRLARDIHDHLGSTLVLAFRHLELYRLEANAGQSVAEEHLTAIESSLEEATGFTHGLISDLRAEAPGTTLEQALVSCVDALNFRKLPVRIAVHGDDNWLPKRQHDELYLILREFLRNSFSHAEADTISVQIAITPRRVDVRADDDGRGFQHNSGRPSSSTPAADGGGGTGLTGMKERAAQLGGQFELASEPGKGARLRMWIPLSEKPDLDLTQAPADTDVSLVERKPGTARRGPA